MEYIILIILSIITAIILKFVFGINFKKAKELTKPNEELDTITNNLPRKYRCLQNDVRNA